MEEKVVVIHQPDFLPYLGFFDRLLKADIYVVLDNVQYVNGTSRSWMNRDKVKTPQGEKWLTVSVKKTKINTLINEVVLSETIDWRRNNLNLIIANYKKARYFDEIMPYIEGLYQVKEDKLWKFNLHGLKILMQLFNIDIPIILASDLKPEGKKNELVVDIVRKVGSRRYLSGIGAKDYYSPESYEAAGIEVLWQDFEHPVYTQQFEGFIPYLSSIDLLFNCGIEGSRKILRQDNR